MARHFSEVSRTGAGNETGDLYASWYVIPYVLGHLCKVFGVSISVAGTGKRARFAAPEIRVGVGLTEPLAQLDGTSVILNAVSSSTLVPVFHQSNGNIAVAGVRRGMERVALWQSASDSGQMITS